MTIGGVCGMVGIMLDDALKDIETQRVEYETKFLKQQYQIFNCVLIS